MRFRNELGRGAAAVAAIIVAEFVRSRVAVANFTAAAGFFVVVDNVPAFVDGREVQLGSEVFVTVYNQKVNEV